jgi:VWFA-related protein
MSALVRRVVPPTLVVLSLALLGDEPLAAGGSSPPQAQPPVFGAAIEVVRLDVIVLDKQGKPVTGLTQDDFVVEEGGQRQAIESFDPVTMAAKPVPAVAAPPRLTAARVRAPAEGRSFYVFFDDAHVTASSAESLRVALRKFVHGELRDGDWITLMAPQQGLWWTARNAWEYLQLESVVDRLKGQWVRDPGERFGSGLSDWDAMCIVEGLPSCPQEKKPGLAAQQTREYRPGSGVGTGSAAPGGGGGGGGGNSGGSAGGAGSIGMAGVGLTNLHMSAEEVYSRARRRIEVTFAGLRQALDSLVPLRGHKALLFVSEGFILIPNMPGYTELLDTARRANVAVHFLDPRGLESGYGGDDPPGLGWATRRNLDMAGADDIAGATGGRSFVSNDPGVGLRQVASESDVYYLLGYSPGAQKPGERKVKVRVTRDGLSVRARSRYYVKNPEKIVARREQAAEKDEALGHTPEERAAMSSLADTTELPLRVTTMQFDPTATGEVTTLCAAEVRLPADARGTRRIGAVSEARPRDGGPAVRDEFEQEVRVVPGAPAIVSRQWRMPPGVWQLRLLVRDTASGRIGTAIHTFEVKAPQGLRLSTPIVTPELEKVDGRDRPRIVLDRSFHPGQVLYCQYQVHGAAPDAQEGLPRVAGSWELRLGDETVRASAPTRIRPAPNGRLSRLLGVSLQGLEPGDYALLLTARDEVSGAVARSSEPFTVVP